MRRWRIECGVWVPRTGDEHQDGGGLTACLSTTFGEPPPARRARPWRRRRARRYVRDLFRWRLRSSASGPRCRRRRVGLRPCPSRRPSRARARARRRPVLVLSASAIVLGTCAERPARSREGGGRAHGRSTAPAAAPSPRCHSPRWLGGASESLVRRGPVFFFHAHRMRVNSACERCVVADATPEMRAGREIPRRLSRNAKAA